MGLIWLKHPVLWHSSRVPSGYDYSKMTAEQQQLIVEKWHNWYTADWDYGRTTVIFLCVGIALSSLLNIAAYGRSRRPSSKQTYLDRATAAMRYITAQQFCVPRFNWYSPPLASILGISGIFTFVMALMLAVRPFYWPNEEMGHSPPIATRSGWISIAIMPFMIAFATKVNFIGLLTATSHEKLQVYHRWTALFMYITSLVHTFPFIINNIMMGEMVSQWQTSPWYWTGVAALVPQTYLVFLSWGIFRNPYYELFKKLHFIAAGIFMAALFIHVNFRLTSWDYFWATAAIYGLSWLLRVVRTFYNSGIGLPAMVEALPAERMVKISIDVPNRFKWSCGQHVFIRFLNLGGLHFFSSHPFTVATIRNTAGERGVVELVVRAHGGITKVLHERAESKAGVSVRVWVDGPYGGVPLSLRDFDHVYLFAGGSGSSFTLPILADLTKGFDEGMHCKHVEFILAVRQNDVEWPAEYLKAARSLAQEKNLHIRVFVTASNVNIAPESASSLSVKSSFEDVHKSAEDAVSGRPDLSLIIEKACRENTGRVAIAACGPDSFLYDIRKSVAKQELEIADGFGICKEVYLHTEQYGW